MATMSADDHNLHHLDQDRKDHCFREWVALQRDDLTELLRSLPLHDNNPNNHTLHDQLVEINVRHFCEYSENRMRMASDDVTAFFTPTWCTSLENSMLWIAGCRPSMFIRLVYVLCGMEVDANLQDFLDGRSCIGGRVLGNLVDLSSLQLLRINQLQAKTIRAEEKLTSKLASLQEEIADQPIANIARRTTTQIGGPDEEADLALDEHEWSMLRVMEAADKLRLDTLRELTEVLTPPQSVEFLAAGKKLHLCIHEWGKRRDHKHGRN